MPKIDLDAIEARANAATREPWTNDNGVLGLGGEYHADVIDLLPEDQDFVAHARTDVPNLAAKVRELEAKVERLQGEREARVKLAHMSFNQTLKCRGDNAALRLAATELYEFVTRDCGLESHGADAIGRMANVLGLDK